MKVTPIKTRKVVPGSGSLKQLLDDYITDLPEKSVVAVTSKVVAIVEGRVAPIAGTDKEELIKHESDLYLPSALSKYKYHFTITNNTLISVAGIDESNSGGDYYVLWPKDPQKTANDIRAHLSSKFKLKNLGVIITDSTCMPLRWGTLGIALSYSGFAATNSYIGKPDLFDRPFKVSQSGVAIGLAAAAVLAMGEGTEQTPLAIIEDLPFVKFQGRDPTQAELEKFYITNYEDDLFAPFIQNVPWQKGRRES
jgi:dihydrofolate synthase / folylpolyglutamate synthase